MEEMEQMKTDFLCENRTTLENPRRPMQQMQANRHYFKSRNFNFGLHHALEERVD
jgi:hypothetical protein